MRWLCVCLVSLVGLVLTHQLRADTVAHWSFEEGVPDTVASGANSILDSSGNDLHGTPLGGPVYRTVTNPGSSLGLGFDGVDDRVSIDDNPLLELTESLTLEAFVRIDSYANSGVIVWRGDDRSGLDPYALQFIGDDNTNPDRRRNLRFFIHPEGGGGLRTGFFTPMLLPLGETFHMAGTLDDATGEMKLFINGNVVAETTTDLRPFGPLDASQRPRVSIGNIDQGGTQSFHGIIDEVRISDVALDPSDFLIPEPSTFALLLMGTVGLLTYAWQRRKRMP